MYSIPSPPHSIIEYNTHYTISNTNTNTCGLKGTDNRTSGLCDVLQTITTTNNNNPLPAAASKDHNPSLLIKDNHKYIITTDKWVNPTREMII